MTRVTVSQSFHRDVTLLVLVPPISMQHALRFLTEEQVFLETIQFDTKIICRFRRILGHFVWRVVWIDVTKFCQFGKIIKVFGNFYLVFGKI